jgi:hypothetical protein
VRSIGNLVVGERLDHRARHLPLAFCEW